MKLNTILRSILFGASLTGASLMANTVYIENTDNDGGLPGGEFKVTASWATFYTFCLESGVSISLPGTYDYSIGTSAMNQGDVLSVGSAWLYEQFYFGTLEGPAVGTNYLDNHDINAGLLQNAFWALEDEGGDTGSFYYTLAVGHFGSAALAKADIAASSKVLVLNLWGASGEDKQSQLVYVPDSGMTVALLGLGLLSIAAFRRKL
jgi:hypothetical protein